MKKLFFLIVFILLVVGFGYWLLFSDFWQVTEFKVGGLNQGAITEEQVLGSLRNKVKERFLSRWLGEDFYWLWKEGSVRLPEIPLLRDVRVERDFWARRVRVIVREREGVGVWCVVNSSSDDEGAIEHCYWYDKEGVAFLGAPRPAGSLIAVINDVDNQYNVKLGEKIMSDSFQNYLNFITESWLFKEVAIDEVLINKEQQELIVKTMTGAEVRLSLRFDPAVNLAAIKQMRSEGTINLADLSYVDLRGENRVYYK